MKGQDIKLELELTEGYEKRFTEAYCKVLAKRDKRLIPPEGTQFPETSGKKKTISMAEYRYSIKEAAGMEIWLKQGRTKFRFAVVPSGYELTSESNNTQVVIHSLGEINLLGKRKLKTVSFSSFFPKSYNSGCCDYKKFPTPKESVKKIEKMKNKGVLHPQKTDT